VQFTPEQIRHSAMPFSREAFQKKIREQLDHA